MTLYSNVGLISKGSEDVATEITNTFWTTQLSFMASSSRNPHEYLHERYAV